MSERKVDGGELMVDSPKAAATPSVHQPSTINYQLPTSPGARAWRRFRKNRLAVISAAFLCGVLAFSLLYPLLSAFRPDQLSGRAIPAALAPALDGHDVHGRDLLVRLCCGAQISLLVASSAPPSASSSACCGAPSPATPADAWTA